MRDEAELSLEPEIRKYLYLHGALWFYFAGTKHTSVLQGCLQIVAAQRRLVEKKGFDVSSKQIAVLKDFQFLLACCKQLCLKKNKHPKVDGRVGKP